MRASALTLLTCSFALVAIAMSSQAWAENSLKSVLERAREKAELDVDFAPGNERDRVTLSLADSELRVRLGEELQLHCEVSSRDQLYAAPPEVGIGLALRFKFQ